MLLSIKLHELDEIRTSLNEFEGYEAIKLLFNKPEFTLR